METTDSWPPQWLRGPLPLCVLRAVEREAAHGYAIATRLEEMGLGTVGGGTLYPILNRLQRDGFLTAEWMAGEGGPGRKVYALTEGGAVELAEQSENWRRFATMTGQALAPDAAKGSTL
ncbi:PadR family transcriptional regulator [Tessaracoccus antarcticus]|uniref:PadR family transcriptional regulator n=1 Tax=Tessaracoccus antarcticus TaxID=2479848 RepID=A0A3M0GD42_9ACTN|nr:PadR family transcriptional regulator [Tessaracoccus antarcticus]RMB59049.1 PadR family transcriptional regulator [Tessaracoccus antarcticus]